MSKSFEELIELSEKFFAALPPPPQHAELDRGSRGDNDSGVVTGSTGSATPDSVSRMEMTSTVNRAAPTAVVRPMATRPASFK
jgi:hypothetical protein